MSNTREQLESSCDVACQNQGAIAVTINPKIRDLGGFQVRRLLPTTALRSVGPWVFFDHMGPASFSPGPGLNVRPHPHIGIATVTYLFEGEILHRDSIGSLQAIRPGDINLMITGSGMVHSERERDERQQQQRSLHGLQLWLALPLEHEEHPPEFLHYPAADIPTATPEQVLVRVMIGSAYGVTSPVKTLSETLYVEAQLTAGQQLTLPSAPELAVYVADGALELDGQALATYSMTAIAKNAGDNVRIRATSASRIAIIGGASLGKRYMEWNFVSSSQARIEKAKQAWREQTFTPVVGDEDEYIPYP